MKPRMRTLHAAGVGCAAYAFSFTYLMLKVIDRITPVRVGAEAEEGLDAAMHGESAYALGV
jgi:Amt family ammonium transporter